MKIEKKTDIIWDLLKLYWVLITLLPAFFKGQVDRLLKKLQKKEINNG